MINEKYSFKDFTGMSFIENDPDEFSDSTIKGACFSQESNDDTLKSIFPVGMQNVVFENCNLDNVLLPKTCTISGSTSNRNIRIMPDGNDWVLGTNKYVLSNRLVVLEPVNKKSFIKENRNIDPAQFELGDIEIEVSK